jgi:hypothetical protein
VSFERIFKPSEKLTDDVVEDTLPAIVRRTTCVVADDAVKAVLPRTAAVRRADDNMAKASFSFLRCCTVPGTYNYTSLYSRGQTSSYELLRTYTV